MSCLLHLSRSEIAVMCEVYLVCNDISMSTVEGKCDTAQVVKVTWYKVNSDKAQGVTVTKHKGKK